MLGVTFVFAVVGCAPSSSGDPGTGQVASTAQSEVGDTFLLRANVIGGQSLTLDDELTRRPVALWFWAPG
jgi:hypothetical protein